jgi:isoaspartyl peptidase/L-asparaginase-like protein (Ntn-hydrolase superfamily)
MELSSAAEEALAYLARRVNGLAGLVAIDPQGNWTRCYNTPHMATACIDSAGKRTLDI